MDGTNLKMDEQGTREELLSSGTRWLLEMELLNNDHMKNALVLNIYKVSGHIKDVELLLDIPNRKMLIYLGLSGFGKLFKRKEFSRIVLDMMGEVLPSFEFRVVFDPSLFLRAVSGLQRVKEKALALAVEAGKKASEKPAQEPPVTPSESPKEG